MTLRRLMLLSTFAGLVHSTPLAGQVSGAFDVGGGALPGFSESETGWAGVARLGWEGDWLRLYTDAAYTNATSARWDATGSASVAVRTPRERRWGAEFETRLRWNGTDAVPLGSVAGIGARLAVPFHSSIDGWVASGVEQPLYNNGRMHPLRTLGAGMDARWGRLGFNVMLQRSWQSTERTTTIPGTDTLSPPTTVTESDRLGFTDITLGGAWRYRAFDAAANLGVRTGAGSSFTPWRVALSRRLTPTVALVAAVGRQAPDLALGMPGGDYVTLGARLNLGSSERRPKDDAVERPMLTSERLAPHLVVVRLHAPVRDKVEIMGDFTNWAPVAMTEEDRHRWRATFPLEPGLYHILMRVDGGDWQVPPETQAVQNEFGREVGVLLVR